jgi:predicted Zn finger-like uncharacterized protein
MMHARCPACQTVFRVRPEQLRAHHGRVRCGHCYTPFDALEHLQDDASASPPRQLTSSATPGTNPENTPLDAEALAPIAPVEAAPPPSGFDALEFGLIDAPRVDGRFDKTSDESTSEPRRPNSFDLLSDRLDFQIPATLISPRHSIAGGVPAPEHNESRADEEAFPEFVDLSDLTPPPSAAPDPDSAPSPFAVENII